MTPWRHTLFMNVITGLLLGLLCINPALALQYQQMDTVGSLRVPSTVPQGPAYHIHLSQQQEIVAQLQQQGYELIPVSLQEAREFVAARNQISTNPVQLAANFNLKQRFEPDCPVRSTLCQAEECERYVEQPPGNCLKPTPPPPPPVIRDEPRGSGSVSINVSPRSGFELPRFNTGGNSNDAAAAMLIVIGIVVIAALFIYAGKWVADAISNDEDYYAYWWDLGANFIALDTREDEHGFLNGLRLSGGFVPNMHTNFGLTAELGSIDLDLIYNRDTQPTPIKVRGNYWLLGPTVRWLIGYSDTEQTVNNSHIYLELLGGSSDQASVDKMFVGRLGFNAGIGQHLRLGLHYGAFYLGLDEKEGIANDGDNYWNMYGLELGYQF